MSAPQGIGNHVVETVVVEEQDIEVFGENLRRNCALEEVIS